MRAKIHSYKGQILTCRQIAEMTGATLHAVTQAAKTGRLDRLGATDQLGRECVINGDVYPSMAAAARAMGFPANKIKAALRRSADDPMLFHVEHKGRRYAVSVRPRREKLRVT